MNIIVKYDISDINKNRNLFDRLNLSAIIKDITLKKPNHKGATIVY